MASKKNKHLLSLKKAWVLAVLIITVAIIALLLVRSFSNKNKMAGSKSTIGATSETTNPTHPTTSAGTPNSTTPSNNKGNDGTTIGSGSNSGSSNAILVAPSGDFVSDYTPNLSGSPHPNTETSTCIVPEGVKCNIEFNMNGVTKSLGAQVATETGAVSWNNWSLQSVGLTQGSWQVTAVASLNNQTKTTVSSNLLVVDQ